MADDIKDIDPANPDTIMDFLGRNIAEGMNPADVNNAMRALGSVVARGDRGTLPLKSDVIQESTTNAGVTIEGVLLKDNDIPNLGITPAQNGIVRYRDEVQVQLPDIVGAAFPPGYFFGGTVGINSVSPANTVDIGAFSGRADANEANITLSAPITKRIDAGWTAGTGNGGLDIGVAATNSLYDLYIIQDPTNGLQDAVFTLAGSPPSLPANYTQKRRIATFGTGATADLSGQITQVHSGGRETFQSALIPIVAAASHTLTHGMPSEPSKVSVWIQCMNDIGGFVAGNRVEISMVRGEGGATSSRGCTVVPSATDLSLKIGQSPNSFSVLVLSTGAFSAINNADWNLLIRAEAG